VPNTRSAAKVSAAFKILLLAALELFAHLLCSKPFFIFLKKKYWREGGIN